MDKTIKQSSKKSNKPNSSALAKEKKAKVSGAKVKTTIVTAAAVVTDLFVSPTAAASASQSSKRKVTAYGKGRGSVKALTDTPAAGIKSADVAENSESKQSASSLKLPSSAEKLSINKIKKSAKLSPSAAIQSHVSEPASSKPTLSSNTNNLSTVADDKPQNISTTEGMTQEAYEIERAKMERANLQKGSSLKDKQFSSCPNYAVNKGTTPNSQAYQHNQAPPASHASTSTSTSGSDIGTKDWNDWNTNWGHHEHEPTYLVSTAGVATVIGVGAGIRHIRKKMAEARQLEEQQNSVDIYRINESKTQDDYKELKREYDEKIQKAETQFIDIKKIRKEIFEAKTVEAMQGLVSSLQSEHISLFWKYEIANPELFHFAAKQEKPDLLIFLATKIIEPLVCLVFENQIKEINKPVFLVEKGQGFPETASPRKALNLKDLTFDSVNNNGDTPLYSAIESGSEHCIQWLLVEQGTSLIRLNLEGDSPIHHAVKKGKREIALKLYGCLLEQLGLPQDSPLTSFLIQLYRDLYSSPLDSATLPASAPLSAPLTLSEANSDESKEGSVTIKQSDSIDLIKEKLEKCVTHFKEGEKVNLALVLLAYSEFFLLQKDYPQAMQYATGALISCERKFPGDLGSDEIKSVDRVSTAKLEALLTLQLERIVTVYRQNECKFEYKPASKLSNKIYRMLDLKAKREEIQLHRYELKKIFDQYKDVYISLKKNTYFFQNLTRELFEKALSLSGKPIPSAYALVSLGEMARSEFCPFSDLQFMLILKEDSHAIREHFKNSIGLMELLVIGLGETPFVSCASSDLLPKGYSFNQRWTPKDKVLISPVIAPPINQFEAERTPEPLTLIGTLENLVNQEIDYPELRSAAYICGNRVLLIQYQKSLGYSRRKSPDFCASPLGELLSKRLITELKKLLRDFSWTARAKLREKSYWKVNVDLYTLASSGIDLIALYYGVSALGAFAQLEGLLIDDKLKYKLQALKKGNLKFLIQDKLDVENAQTLRSLMNFILRLRIEAQFHYHSAQEDFILKNTSLLAQDDRIFTVKNHEHSDFYNCLKDLSLLQKAFVLFEQNPAEAKSFAESFENLKSIDERRDAKEADLWSLEQIDSFFDFNAFRSKYVVQIDLNSQDFRLKINYLFFLERHYDLIQMHLLSLEEQEKLWLQYAHDNTLQDRKPQKGFFLKNESSLQSRQALTRLKEERKKYAEYPFCDEDEGKLLTLYFNRTQFCFFRNAFADKSFSRSERALFYKYLMFWAEKEKTSLIAELAKWNSPLEKLIKELLSSAPIEVIQTEYVDFSERLKQRFHKTLDSVQRNDPPIQLASAAATHSPAVFSSALPDWSFIKVDKLGALEIKSWREKREYFGKALRSVMYFSVEQEPASASSVPRWSTANYVVSRVASLAVSLLPSWPSSAIAPTASASSEAKDDSLVPSLKEGTKQTVNLKSIFFVKEEKLKQLPSYQIPNILEQVLLKQSPSNFKVIDLSFGENIDPLTLTFCFNPVNPGRTYFISRLQNKLIDQASLSELVILEQPNLPPLPILVSESPTSSKLLYRIFDEGNGGVVEQLRRLDYSRFCEIALFMMLIGPDEGWSDHYRLDKEHLTLSRVDENQASYKQFPTILFCFDLFNTSTFVDSNVANRFEKMPIIFALEAVLEDLKDQTERYSQLGDFKISIEQGYITKLYNKLIQLRNFLKDKHGQVTLMDCFAELEPGMARHYKTAFKKHCTFRERYHSLIPYLNTLVQSKKRKERQGEKLLLNPDQALRELRLAEYQQAIITRTRSELEKGSLQGFQALTVSEHKAYVISGQEGKNLDWSKLQPAQQKTVLSLMKGVVFRCLSLVNCAELTLELLVSFLDYSPDLQELDLSQHPDLNERWLLQISKVFLQLKHLTLSGCQALKSFSSGFSFPELEQLDLRNCSELKTLDIRAPKLQNVSVVDCLNLEKLSTQSQNLQVIEMVNCPKLTSMRQVALGAEAGLTTMSCFWADAGFQKVFHEKHKTLPFAHQIIKAFTEPILENRKNALSPIQVKTIRLPELITYLAAFYSAHPEEKLKLRYLMEHTTREKTEAAIHAAACAASLWAALGEPFQELSLAKTNLSGADLSDAKLDQVQWQGAILQGVRFQSDSDEVLKESPCSASNDSQGNSEKKSDQAAASSATPAPQQSIKSISPFCFKLEQSMSLSPISAVACSQDGRFFLSGRMDGLIQLWDLKTFAIIKIFKGDRAAILSLSFTPKGYPLSASKDGTIRLWDPRAEKCIKILQGEQSAVNSIACSPDGCFLISGSNDRTVRLWDLGSGKCAYVGNLHSASVQSVFFNFDGISFVSVDAMGSLIVWNRNPLRLIAAFDLLDFKGPLSFSSDLRSLIYNKKNGQLTRVSLAMGVNLQPEFHTQNLSMPNRADATLTNIVFSPDGNTILLNYEGGNMQYWDIRSQSLICTFIGSSASPLRELAKHHAMPNLFFSPDGLKIFSATQAGDLLCWLRPDFIDISEIQISAQGIADLREEFILIGEAVAEVGGQLTPFSPIVSGANLVLAAHSASLTPQKIQSSLLTTSPLPSKFNAKQSIARPLRLESLIDSETLLLPPLNFAEHLPSPQSSVLQAIRLDDHFYNNFVLDERSVEFERYFVQYFHASFTAFKVLATGLVKRTENIKDIAAGSFANIGELLSIPILSGFLKIASMGAKSKINDAEQKKYRKYAMCIPDARDLIAYSTQLAKRLAVRYHVQIQQLSQAQAYLLADCAIARILIGMDQGIITGQYSFVDECLRAIAYLKKKLGHIAFTSENMSLFDIPGHVPYLTHLTIASIKNEEWTEAGIFTETGVVLLSQIGTLEYYDRPNDDTPSARVKSKAKVRQYNYRLGDVCEKSSPLFKRHSCPNEECNDIWGKSNSVKDFLQKLKTEAQSFLGVGVPAHNSNQFNRPPLGLIQRKPSSCSAAALPPQSNIAACPKCNRNEDRQVVSQCQDCAATTRNSVPFLS